VIKIITANADNDALINPGNTINPGMKDTIKVTVVATGFNPEHKAMRRSRRSRNPRTRSSATRTGGGCAKESRGRRRTGS
jgi:cell division GTPase FtsZ